MTIPTQMQAIAINEAGGPDVLVPRTVPVPVPGANEVLIAVAAAGVNGPDLAQRQGHYAPPPNASPFPGLEVAGTIVARGPDAARFALGDDVVALVNGGGYAEFVAVPQGQVLPKPPAWTMIEAATLPETFFTLQQTLIERGGLAQGRTVLIHGGAGGIGTTAIQLCALYGATALATVSSDEKARYARDMGAAHTIDYREEDFVARTRELTGGKGADIIIDIIGGDYAARNIKAAATGGHILQLAIKAGATAEINLGLVLVKALTLSGSTLRPQPEGVKARLAGALEKTVWPAIAEQKIVPPFIRTFALEDANKAHHAMEAKDHYGKIVLVPGGNDGA